MPGLAADDIRELFLAACRAELYALKPGNVHVHAGGHGMEVAHFQAGAEAAAPAIAASGKSVGTRVLRAIEASLAAAGCNTNLGILLLAAPLAAAAEAPQDGDLRERVHTVLAGLDETDAAAVFEAIRRANPGGLGTVAEEDVAAAPTLGLLQAMALAADRDRIAHNYVTDFEDIFAFGLPALKRALHHADNLPLAVTTLHMAYLAQFPDSHIIRKFGTATAVAVQQEAQGYKALWEPAAGPAAIDALLAFDADLKQRNINPGTTADLVVGTLFAASLCGRLGVSSLA